MTATYGFPYVVEKISDALVARLSPTSIVLADDNTISFGRDRLREQLAAPRVVVVPRGGAFGGRDAAFPGNAPAAKVQRPRMSRRAAGEVHCWGRTYEEAELLMDQFCNAALDVAIGQLEWSPASWAEETNIAQYGQRIAFGFSVIVPIVDGPVALAPVGTKVQHEGHLVLPNGTDITAC